MLVMLRTHHPLRPFNETCDVGIPITFLIDLFLRTLHHNQRRLTEVSKRYLSRGLTLSSTFTPP